MGIFEKPAGTYWINYYDEKGKRRREKAGKNKAIAEKLLVKRKEAVRQFKLFPEEHKAKEAALTVKEMVQKYLPLFERKRSFKDDKRYAKYCIKEFGTELAKDLKPSQIDAYRSRRLKEAKPATVNRCVAFLKRVYKLAADDDLVTKNPVSKLKMLAENNLQREDWTPEEEARVLAASKPEHQRMFRLALLTGMRGGELFGRKQGDKWVSLEWPQVDLVRAVIKLDGSQTKNGEAREVELSADAVAILREQREAVPTGCRWVFPGRKKTEPMRRDSVYWALQRACERAGIPRKRLHSTRHAFCSQLLMEGVPLKTVSELAGHLTTAITAEMYGHINAEHKKDAVAALSARRQREGRA